MKKLILFLCVLIVCSCRTEKTSRQTAGTPKAIPFHPGDVELLDSPFKHACEVNSRWLLSMEPDRYLHRFHLNAGFEPKAPHYGGWESLGVGGQSMGHYLSACSRMYAATGERAYKEITDYIISELARCQAARGTGYVGSILNEDTIWAEVSRGDIRSAGFDLNGGWVPWYVLHKLWAGLVDVYRYTANEQAREVVVKLSDWAYNSFKDLTDEQWQQILACEHGGMLESLVDVYVITGDEKYLKMSHWFDHKKLFEPLRQHQDSLAYLHANTQVPKIVGLARRYAVTGDRDDQSIAEFFWHTVTCNHSYCTGGNSDGEHFGKPRHLSNRLSDHTTETCNTHNMLRLSKILYEQSADPAYYDFYEKALYNHILASQHPETGMVTYYVPLVAGSRRHYSTPFESFTCCVGTGMENHTKYGEAIYFKNPEGGLYVNLFIPSRLHWKEAGVVITQETTYPLEGTISLSVNSQKETSFPLSVRYPEWATQGCRVLINGKEQKVSAVPGEYIVLKRKWKDNDRVEISFPMPVYLDPMPDKPECTAIKYGPLVLAGRLGNGVLDPVKDIPVLITNDKPVEEWLTLVSPEEAIFRTNHIGFPVDFTLAPFYTLYDEKYIVYFDLFDREGWTEKQEAYKAYLQEEENMKQRTIDFLQPGEMQPERDHNMRGEDTAVGLFMEKPFRLCWNNGWYAFDMNVRKDVPMQLVCTYWGNDDRGNSFDILVDDEVLTSITMNAPYPDVFYDLKFDLPEHLVKGKDRITLTFRSHPDKMVGRLFGCRLIQKS